MLPLMQAGTIVDDKYQIVEPIRAGGFAAVYKAWQIDLERIVALKLLHSNALQIDREASKRFEREAAILANLQHSNLVSVFGFGVWQDSFYMTLECVEGRDLQAVVSEDGPLTPQRALAIFQQVCEALACLEAYNVVHRDIKPANILLNAQNQVKIIDFGLAMDIESGQRLTEPGCSVGTVQYMSPEQCRGADVDVRSDIYAAGSVLYFMLTGLPPYEGDNAFAVLRQHINSAPPSLGAKMLNTERSQMQKLVNQCMAKSPADRYQSAKDVLRAIKSSGGDYWKTQWKSGIFAASAIVLAVGSTLWLGERFFVNQEESASIQTGGSQEGIHVEKGGSAHQQFAVAIQNYRHSRDWHSNPQVCDELIQSLESVKRLNDKDHQLTELQMFEMNLALAALLTSRFEKRAVPYARKAAEWGIVNGQKFSDFVLLPCSILVSASKNDKTDREQAIRLVDKAMYRWHQHPNVTGELSLLKCQLLCVGGQLTEAKTLLLDSGKVLSTNNKNYKNALAVYLSQALHKHNESREAVPATVKASDVDQISAKIELVRGIPEGMAALAEKYTSLARGPIRTSEKERLLRAAVSCYENSYARHLTIVSTKLKLARILLIERNVQARELLRDCYRELRESDNRITVAEKQSISDDLYEIMTTCATDLADMGAEHEAFESVNRLLSNNPQLLLPIRVRHAAYLYKYDSIVAARQALVESVHSATAGGALSSKEAKDLLFVLEDSRLEQMTKKERSQIFRRAYLVLGNCSKQKLPKRTE
jgi:serine/threonine protein kinase